MQQLQGGAGADRVGDGPDGGGVVEVAAGGGLGEQQVVADERGDDVGVRGVEAEAGGDRAGDALARLGVVAGAALADVVQQGREEQEVGPADAAGQRGGAHRRLDEVAVDGPGVHGVALRAAAHVVPLGQQPGDDALGLEGLPDLHHGLARPEQGDELLTGLGGPGHRQRAGGGHAAHGVPGQRQARLGGGGRGAQGQDGVVLGAGGAGEDDLAVLLDHALRQRDPLGLDEAAAAAAPAEDAAQPGSGGAGTQHAAHLAPGDVGGVGDGAGGLVDLAEQRVGVGEAAGGGDLVLFLEGEPVGGAAGGQVEGVAGVEQEGAGRLEALAGGVGEPGGGDGPQGGGVAEAAAGLLEVGFQQEAQLALPPGAFLAQFAQLGQAVRGLGAPVLVGGGAQGGGEVGVAGEVAGVEEAEVDLEVAAGGLAGLGGGAYGVVEGEALVPDGVPEAVGDGGDLGRAGGAVVQEQDVEVAAGGELAAPVAADGDERDAPGGAQETAEPAVGDAGQAGAPGRAGQGLLLEEPRRAAA